jgi:hypothetical protein
MPSWFDEVITPDERKEAEEAVQEILVVLNRFALVCGAIPDFIDARMRDAQE